MHALDHIIQDGACEAMQGPGLGVEVREGLYPFRELAGAGFRTPTAINAPRMSKAPRMPQNNTRCWYAAGTAKNVKIMTMTKMLSTLSDFSTR